MKMLEVNTPEQGGDVWDITIPGGAHITVGRDEEDSDNVRMDIYSPKGDFFGSIVVIGKEVIARNKDGKDVSSFILD
jgi:hypothetical protein